jgi:hypothetical protein
VARDEGPVETRARFRARAAVDATDASTFIPADAVDADMSDTDAEADLVRRAYRTVTPWYEGRDDVEMNTLGWALFLGLVIMLVPLLPFLLLVWLVTKVIDALTPDEGGGD